MPGKLCARSLVSMPVLTQRHRPLKTSRGHPADVAPSRSATLVTPLRGRGQVDLGGPHAPAPLTLGRDLRSSPWKQRVAPSRHITRRNRRIPAIPIPRNNNALASPRNSASFDQSIHVLLSNGFGDVVSLAINLHHFSQPLELSPGFDTLHDDVLLQAASKLDERFDHRSRFGTFMNVAHEGSIQLECIDSQTMQFGQRPAPRTKIIDCNTRPKISNRCHGRGKCLYRARIDGLRQFNLKIRGTDGVGIQNECQSSCHSRPRDFMSRQIDGQRQIVMAKRSPTGEHTRGLLDHIVSESACQMRIFDEVNERRRHQHAALRMLPAYQRLESGQQSGLKAELWLINEKELLPRQSTLRVFDKNIGIATHGRTIHSDLQCTHSKFRCPPIRLVPASGFHSAVREHAIISTDTACRRRSPSDRR